MAPGIVRNIKRLLAGTPLEAPARRAYRLFRPLTPPDPENDELPLLKSLPARMPPDTNVIDVGANAGQILEFLVKAFPRGRHFAFEAIPELCGELGRKFPHVSVHNLAVADYTGTVSFNHVTTNSGFSGIQRRTDLRAEDQVAQIEVAVGRLDDLIPAGLPIGFLKIDVEGAELGVLRGARRILSEFRPTILFEHGAPSAPLYGTSPEDVYALLNGELGYAIDSISGTLAGGPGMSGDEFVRTFRTGRIFMFVARASG